MIFRKVTSTEAVQWGNGTSSRLLTQRDGMGFTVAYTTVFSGTESKLQYRRHLEACYCISGRGKIVTQSGEIYELEPGTMYALDEHDAHSLIANADGDLHLISIFNPPLVGNEKHALDEAGYSQY